MFTKFTDTYFFTATINNWQQLLLPDNRKQIILSALKFLVEKEKILLHAFVIMPNHIHLLLTLKNKDITQNLEQNTSQEKIGFQLSLLRFTAKAIIKDMKFKDQPSELLQYQSSQMDRNFQIWERRSKWISINNLPIFLQKLDYIHNNPLQEKWKLSETPEAYHWSSAGVYENGEQNDFISFI